LETFKDINYKHQTVFLIIILTLLLLNPLLIKSQPTRDSLRLEIKDKKISIIHRISALNDLAASLNRDSTNQALIYAHDAYLLSLKENQPDLQVISLLNLSEGYLYNDIYDQALQYGFAALDIAKKINDPVILARCNTNLGWIFYDTENANFSLQYHKDALALFSKGGDSKKVAQSLNAIGLVFQMKGQNDSAKIFFEKALKTAREQHSKSIVSAALNNIGICENVKGKYNNALFYFKSAMEVRESSYEPLTSAETQNQMAFSYLKLKDYRRADSLLKSSRELISQSSSNSKKEKLLDNLHVSSQLYEALGEYKKAFENLREYTEVSNEIISRNKSDVIASLKLKKETQ
jgi:tetratricopeptide (TPR) repeat protein